MDAKPWSVECCASGHHYFALRNALGLMMCRCGKMRGIGPRNKSQRQCQQCIARRFVDTRGEG